MIRVISQNEWIRFFSSFNKDHRNLIVSVNVEDKNNGGKELVKELPLKELDVNVQDAENNIVTIVAGDSSTITHFIDKTKKIEIEQTEDKLPKKIIIDSEEGSKTIINFHSMA